MVTFTAAPSHAIDFNTSFKHLNELSQPNGINAKSVVSAATSAGFTDNPLVGSSWAIIVSGHDFDYNFLFDSPIAGAIETLALLDGSPVLGNVGTFSGLSLDWAAFRSDIATNTAKVALSHVLAGEDTIVGSALGDRLKGFAGNDTIRGKGGNDRLLGGDGNDTLTGGLGKDHFVFDTALNKLTNVDRIIGFSAPNDTIDINNAVFAAVGADGKLAAARFFVGTHAHDANDRIIYNPVNGFVSYDSNGNAAGHAVHFATFAPHLALTSADFLVL